MCCQGMRKLSTKLMRIRLCDTSPGRSLWVTSSQLEARSMTATTFALLACHCTAAHITENDSSQHFLPRGMELTKISNQNMSVVGRLQSNEFRCKPGFAAMRLPNNPRNSVSIKPMDDTKSRSHATISILFRKVRKPRRECLCSYDTGSVPSR